MKLNKDLAIKKGDLFAFFYCLNGENKNIEWIIDI